MGVRVEVDFVGSLPSDLLGGICIKASNDDIVPINGKAESQNFLKF